MTEKTMEEMTDALKKAKKLKDYIEHLEKMISEGERGGIMKIVIYHTGDERIPSKILLPILKRKLRDLKKEFKNLQPNLTIKIGG